MFVIEPHAWPQLRIRFQGQGQKLTPVIRLRNGLHESKHFLMCTECVAFSGFLSVYSGSEG